MRAVKYPQFGTPEEILGVEDIPTPEPGPGEVRVRVVLSPIHNHDLWTIRGEYGFKPELPAQAGTEAVGVVDALGEGVDNLAVGQRVATGQKFGAWAEFFVAKATGLIPVPDTLSDEDAAQLLAMPYSSITLLDQLNLSAGQWLIQNAANGAVGRTLAQLAAARGVNVISLVRRGAGVQELAAIGIDRAVATDEEGWQDKVRAIVGDAPIIAGVDSVGGRATGDMMQLLGENSTLMVFGAMESPVVKIPSGDLIFKQATVKGFWASTVSATMDRKRNAELMAELIDRVGAGELTLPVEAVYPLEKVRDAVAANATAGRSGKILLKP